MTKTWNDDELKEWLATALSAAPAHLNTAITASVAAYQADFHAGKITHYDPDVLQMLLRLLRHHTSLAGLRRAKQQVNSDLSAAVVASHYLGWNKTMISRESGLAVNTVQSKIKQRTTDE